LTENPKPAVFEWTGKTMRPIEYHMPLCSRQYVAGARYRLAPFTERSKESHDHYFKLVAEAFQQWPEKYEIALADDDQLRKHALIRTRHYKQFIVVAPTRDAVSGLMSGFVDDYGYAEFSVVDTTIVVRVAKTQKKKVMGAADFQRSKQDVLDFLSAAIGIDVTTLIKEAGKAA
jgi:hypothetical protein